jgi:hypothetical protein
MLARLNRRQRLRAGWCVALAYLLCVLAPSAAFAFANGSLSAPCIIEDHGPGMPMHPSAVRDVDATGAVYDHGQSDHSQSVAGEEGSRDNGALPAKAPHKTAHTDCCGLVSPSAFPASEITLAKPSTLTSRCETESCRHVADNTPPRLDRPPIS